MSMQDPISDLLTRIRNAQMVQKETVGVSASKIKEAILKVLEKEGIALLRYWILIVKFLFSCFTSS